MLALIIERWRAGQAIDRDSAEFELVQQGHPYREVHPIISRFVDEVPVLLCDPARPVPYLAGLVELGDPSSEEDLEKLALLMSALRSLYRPDRRQPTDEVVSQYSGLPLDVVQRLAPLTGFKTSEGFHLSNEILGWETFEDFLDQRLPRREELRARAQLAELQIDFVPSFLRWTNLGPYREGELQLSPLTVLVGANAAGKTSALRVINWVGELMRAGLDAIEEPFPSSASGLVRRDAIVMGLSIGGELRKREEVWTKARWSANFSMRPRPVVHRETLQLGDAPTEAQLEQGIGYWLDENGLSRPLHLLTNQLAIREAVDPQRHAAFIAMRQSMERWHAETASGIDEDVFYALLEEVSESDLRHTLDAVVGPVQVKQTGRKRWTFSDRRKYETELVAAPRGILQVVFLLAHLLHPVRPSLLAFDEIENHLHADVVERLIDVMRSYTDRTRIVLTTHSGNVLRLLEPSEVRLVRMEEDGSSIVRIDQDPVLSRLAKRGDMAKLLEDGFFAGGL
jgi:predicted ATPase